MNDIISGVFFCQAFVGRSDDEESELARVGRIVQKFPSGVRLFLSRIVPNNLPHRAVGCEA